VRGEELNPEETNKVLFKERVYVRDSLLSAVCAGDHRAVNARVDHQVDQLIRA
jgi:hypothetical protein